jgi:hypothetical protein
VHNCIFHCFIRNINTCLLHPYYSFLNFLLTC